MKKKRPIHLKKINKNNQTNKKINKIIFLLTKHMLVFVNSRSRFKITTAQKIS